MRPLNKPAPDKLPRRSGWTRARMMEVALVDTIGDYCAFCELPIGSEPHIQSKAYGEPRKTPALADWPDLLLACDYCREHRTAGPVDTSRYLWPDVDATFTLTGESPFVYELTDVKVVQAAAAASSQPVKVVLVKANPSAPAGVMKKAQATIDLYQLNTPYYDRKTNTLTLPKDDVASFMDLRLEYRTREWHRAQEAIRLLEAAMDRTDLPGFWIAIRKNASMMAQTAGFWSVWMTTFWQAFGDPKLIDALFVETKTAEGYVLTGYQTLPKPPAAGAARDRPAIRPLPPPEHSYMIFTGTAKDRIRYPSS